MYVCFHIYTHSVYPQLVALYTRAVRIRIWNKRVRFYNVLPCVKIVQLKLDLVQGNCTMFFRLNEIILNIQKYTIKV